MVYNWINYIQFLLYPPTCLLCGARGDGDMDICTPCREELPYIKSSCSICSLPLPVTQKRDPVCGNCLKQPPPFDRCFIPFSYDDPLTYLISSFKFSGKLQHGRLLSELYIKWIDKRNIEKPDLIIPVPLHPSRLRERGFNQALEIAKPIARHLNVPISNQICIRTRATESQSNLKKMERRKNVRNAFNISKIPEHDHLVLLDDVVTTGNTVLELANQLKKRGVKRIDVWALARTT